MLKNFEIKLNSVQSILLIISIFAIGILSFALGFTIGKNSSPDIIALKDSSQEGMPPFPQIEKRVEDVTQPPPPAVSESHVASSEKTIQKETPGTIQTFDKTKTPDAGKLTFFKTLPEVKSARPSERLKAQTTEKEQKKEDVQTVIPSPQKEAQGRSQEPMAKLSAPLSHQSPPLQPFYTVQAGSFKTMDDASKLKSKLEGKGYQSYITTYDTPDGKWFRVRIGQFKTREQAESTAKKLKTEENLATFIASYK
jgi:cell division protein FtsN